MECPLCKEHDLEVRTNRKGNKTLCCEDWKPMLADEDDKDSWTNLGDCDFKIPFKNKLFGDLDMDDIKTIMQGEVLENEDGATIELDLESQYFTKVTFNHDEVTKEKFDI